MLNILSIFKRKQPQFFSEEENIKIVQAIQSAERRTSGEIRLHVESNCRFVDALDRAAEIFYALKMEATELRNAVLVYVAIKDKQLAIFADENIYIKAGTEFWKNEVQTMLSQFNKENHAVGLVQVIHEIGEILSRHFPYDEKIDKNELPDEILFGK